MADEYRGLTIQFKGDTTGLRAALQQIQGQSRKAEREMRAIGRALAIDPKSGALLAENLKSATRAAEQAADKVEALKAGLESADGPEAVDRLNRELAVAEAYAKRAREQLVAASEAASDLGRAEASIRAWGQSLRDAGERVSAMGERIKAVGATVRGVGERLTAAVTLPVAAAAGASVKAAVGIDSAWYGVRKTVDATEDELLALKDGAIELSKVQPVPAETILNIEELGGQLGISTANLEEFAQVISGLDIATNMDAETAATELARFMNITGASQGTVSNLASAVVDLGNHFATTESDIVSMAGRLASAAHQAGMTDADILGLSTALSSLGMEAEAGGTAVSRVINGINSSVATGSESLADYAKVAGMSAGEFAAAWRDDAARAFEVFLEGVARAGEEAGATQVVLDELGITEIRTSDAMRRFAGNTGLVSDALSRASSAYAENTALAEEVGNRNESLASKFEVLRNRLVAVMEDIGAPIADALLAALDAAEPLFRAVEEGAQRFADMSTEEQRAVIQTAAMAAAVGPLTGLLGSVVGGVGSLVGGFGKLVSGIGGAADRAADATGFIKTFTGALTATNPQLVKGYRESGKLAAKLGLMGNAAAGSKGGMAALKAAVEGVGSTAKAVADGGLQLLGLGLKAVGPLALAAVAAAGIAMVVGELVEADRHSRLVAQAQGELAAAVDGAVAKMADESGSVEELGRRSATTRGELDQLWQDHLKLSDSIKEVNLSAQRQKTDLYGAWGAIEELANRSGLGAEDQQRLKDAVDRVNEACGTQYSVVDAANGKIADQSGVIQDSTEAIKDNIDQRLKQIELEQYESQVSSLNEQKAKDIEAYTKAQKDLNDAIESRKEFTGFTGEAWDRFFETWKNWDGKAYYDALTETGDALRSTNSALETAEENFRAVQEASGGLAEGYEAAVYSIGDLATACTASGVSIRDISRALEDAGADTERLAALTPQQLSEVAAAYDGTTASIVGKLEEFGVDCLSAGEAAANEWRRGLSDGARGAVDAAVEATGQTLEAFREATGRYGIEGDAAVQAYAGALSEGAAEAEAAAVAVSGKALGRIRSEAGEFAVCGQASIDAYVAAIAEGQPEDVARRKALLAADALRVPEEAGACGSTFIRAYIEAVDAGDPADAARAKALEAVGGLKQAGDYATPEGRAFIDAYVAAIESGSTLEAAAEAARQAVEGLGSGEGAAAEKGIFTKAAFNKAVSADDGSVAAAFASIGAQIEDQQPILDNAARNVGTGVTTSLGSAVIDGSGTVVSATGQLAPLVGQSLDSLTLTSSAKGSEAVAALAGSISTGGPTVGSAAAGLDAAAMAGVAGLPAKMGSTGSDGWFRLAGGLGSGAGAVSASSSQLAGAAEGPVSPLPAELGGYGSDGSSMFASGLVSGKRVASINAGVMAAQAQLMNQHASSAFGWGSGMSGNFAAGIRAGVGAALSAARAVASAVAGVLHHTTPDEGPMEDDDVWGLHFARNFAEGIEAGVPEVRRAALAMAGAAVVEPPSYGGLWEGARLSAAVASAAGGRDGAVLAPRVEIVQSNKVVRSGSDLDSAMQVINRSMLSAAREVFR